MNFFRMSAAEDSDVSMEVEEVGIMKSFGATPIKRPERLIPWIEKYRPDTVSEISHQDDVVNALNSCIQKANVSFTPLRPIILIAPPLVVLWTTRNRQDLVHHCSHKTALWVSLVPHHYEF